MSGGQPGKSPREKYALICAEVQRRLLDKHKEGNWSVSNLGEDEPEIPEKLIILGNGKTPDGRSFSVTYQHDLPSLVGNVVIRTDLLTAKIYPSLMAEWKKKGGTEPSNS